MTGTNDCSYFVSRFLFFRAKSLLTCQEIPFYFMNVFR